MPKRNPQRYLQAKRRRMRKTRIVKAPQASSGWSLSGIASTAAKALSIGKKLIDAVNIEYKEVSQSMTAQQVTWLGRLVLINNCPQGVGKDQHIGISQKNQNVVVRGWIAGDSSPGAFTKSRVILFWDKQMSVSTGGDVLQYAGTINAPNSEKNDILKYETKILYDRSFTHMTGTSTQVREFEIKMPINKHSHYTGDNTDVLKDGGLYLLFINNQNPATTTANVTFQSNVSFTDD